MTNRELRKLAESKGVGFMMAQGMFFFVFPGDLKAHAATKETIEQVRAMSLSVPAEVPANAVSLEGLSQEEREAKVLELASTKEKMWSEPSSQPEPNTIPGLDNYPIVEKA